MYIYELLSENLSSYRKHYSCNNVLVKCIEDFRKALDLGDCIGCVLIDLSSAFDSISHGLLIAKLNAYELFIRQKLKSQNCTFPKQLAITKRGVPQGSMAGPLLFFMNDCVLQLGKFCRVYNYADDNTLTSANKDRTLVQNALEHALNVSLEWFNGDFMVANQT